MKQTKDPKQTKLNHQEAYDLLPWYANGTLEKDELQQVEQHLEHCTECQQAFEEYQVTQEGVKAQQSETTWQPSNAHFQNIMSQVDATSTQNEPVKGKSSFDLWERLHNWFAELLEAPATVRWTLAGQAALVLCLSVVVGVMIPKESPDATFQTFSTESASKSDATKLIRVVFSQDMPLNELTQLLNQVSAKIIDGPSKHGVFTISVQEGEITEALSALREDGKVKFAEQVATE